MLNIGGCFYEIHRTKITALGHVHLRTNSSIHLILTEFPLSQGQCKKSWQMEQKPRSLCNVATSRQKYSHSEALTTYKPRKTCSNSLNTQNTRANFVWKMVLDGNSPGLKTRPELFQPKAHLSETSAMSHKGCV